MISLWGFMGSGKTAAASALSTILNQKGLDFRVLDSDQVIESREGRSIKEIFNCDGETHFRSLEHQFLLSLLERREEHQQVILSTGGGMPIQKENRTILAQLGTSVFLDVPFELIKQRLKNDLNRPLWDEAQEEQMYALFNKRYKSYSEADFIIPAGDRSPEQIALELTKYVTLKKG